MKHCQEQQYPRWNDDDDEVGVNDREDQKPKPLMMMMMMTTRTGDQPNSHKDRLMDGERKSKWSNLPHFSFIL